MHWLILVGFLCLILCKRAHVLLQPRLLVDECFERFVFFICQLGLCCDSKCERLSCAVIAAVLPVADHTRANYDDFLW
jgi:hypothetical protein